MAGENVLGATPEDIYSNAPMVGAVSAPEITPAPAPAPVAEARKVAPTPIDPDVQAYLTKRDTQQQSRQATASAMTAAVNFDPNEYARARKAAAYLPGLEPKVLMDDPELLKQVELRKRAENTDLGAIVRSNPNAANWLSEPNNAILAQDDTANIAALSQLGNEFLANLGAGDVSSAAEKVIPLVGGSMATFPVLGNFLFRPAGAAVTSTNQGLWGLAGAAADLVGADTFGNFAAKQAGSLDKQTEALLNAQGLNVLQRGIQSGIVSMAQMALLGPTSRSAAMIAGARANTVGLSSASAMNLTTNAQALGFVTPMSIITGGTTYGADRAKGASGLVAGVHAASDAAIEGATELIWAKKFAAETLGFTGNWAKGFLKSMGEDVVGEQLATLGQNFNAQAAMGGIDKKTWGDWFENIPAAALDTLIATVTQNLLMGGAAAIREKRYSQPAVTKANFDDLFEAAQQSLVLQRDPAAMQTLLQSVTHDQSVFIDPDALLGVLAQNGMDPATVLSADVLAQLQNPEPGGPGIEIKAAALVTSLAGTPAAAQITPHIRLTAESLTAVEAEQSRMAESLTDIMQAQADKIMAEGDRSAAFKMEAQAIHSEVRDALIKTDQFTAAESNGMARMMSAFYVTRAASQGVTPAQVVAGYTKADGTVVPGVQLPAYLGTGTAATTSAPQASAAAIADRAYQRSIANQKAPHEAARVDAERAVLDADKAIAVLDKRITVLQRVEAAAAARDANAQTDAKTTPAEKDKAATALAAAQEALTTVQAARTLQTDTKTQAEAKAQAEAALSADIGTVGHPSVAIAEAAASAAHDLYVRDPGGAVLAQNTPATMADFTRDSVHDILNKSNWAILTAENPNGEAASAEENRVMNEDLRLDLLARGKRIEQISGRYNQVENPYVILGITEDEALELVALYNQESILIQHGLLYRDGTVAVSTGINVFSEPQEDFFSTLPDGTQFSTVIDFDVPRIPLASAIAQAHGEGSILTQPSGRTNTRFAVVSGYDFGGTGADSMEFFSDAVTGGRAPIKAYTPLLDVSAEAEFQAAYDKHLGNFDAHIAASIPGFPEVQVAIGHAITQYLPAGGSVLDIAGSEGGLMKAISEVSNGSIKTVVLDPNPDMAAAFARTTVPGASNIVAAFGPEIPDSANHAMHVAWTEADGTEVLYYQQDRIFDVIHESMGFQFMSNARNAQVARAKELLATNGLAIFEEKLADDLTAQYEDNEAKKDRYKAQYFTADALAQKEADVLGKRKGASMGSKMATEEELITVLLKHFNHVVQYWSSGNFAGYAVSDSLDNLMRFVENLDNLNSEFSTTATPDMITAVPERARDSNYVKQLMDTVESERAAAKDRERVRLNLEYAKLKTEYMMLLDKEFEAAIVARTDESLKQLGTTYKVGQVAGVVAGIHFSKEPRNYLLGANFGTGIPGAERARLETATDSRIKNRVAFYVAMNGGVVPEVGLGRHAHVSYLENLYDADADVLKLFRNNGRNLNATESGIIDAGFDGYLVRSTFTTQGAVVMLGTKPVPAQYVGGMQEANEKATQPPAPDMPLMKEAALRLVNTPGLPGGAVGPARWKAMLDIIDPELSEMIPWPDIPERDAIYKDELSRYLWQGGEWYYSPLTVGVQGAPVKALTTGKGAKQWLLSNAPKLGIKKEEVEATGITDWLDTQEKTSKQDILDFLDAGGVKVRTVTYASATPEQARAWMIERWPTAAADFEALSAADALNAAGGRGYAPAVATQFEDYTEPGGTNYREVVLTIDDRSEIPEKAIIARMDALRTEINAFATTEARKEAANTEYKALQALGIGRFRASKDQKAGFTSTHFPEAGAQYLAHLRLSDREESNGRRFLFLEESQTDRGQQGREHGFLGSAVPPLDTTGWSVERFDSLDGVALVRVLDADGVTRSVVFDNGERDERALAWAVAKDEADRRDNAGIAPAPFIRDTQSWTALIIKRTLALAVEGGYDGIAWPTGAQQNARYGMSGEPISSITVVDRFAAYESSGLEVRVFNARGMRTRTQVVKSWGELAGLVSADAIAKIRAGAGEDPGTWSAKLPGEVFDRNDGMLTYYDKILPAVVRDAARKIGGSAVSSVSLTRPSKGDGRSREYDYDEIARILADGGEVYLSSSFGEERVASQAELDEYIDEYQEPDGYYLGDLPDIAQPALWINEKMRANVSGGVPLFAAATFGPRTTSAKGLFNPRTKEIRFLAAANFTTVVHETAHFFLVSYEQLAKSGADEQAGNDFEAFLAQRGIASIANWDAMTFEQQRPHHEAFAESFEEYVMTGKAPSVAFSAMFAAFSKTMLRLYGSIQAFKAQNKNAYLNPDLASIMDRMLATEEAIAEAEARLSFQAMFASAADAGMTDKQFAEYMRIVGTASDDAEAILRLRSMRDMKWLSNAQNKFVKAWQKEAEERRAAMLAKITKEVEDTPLRQAIRFFRTGKVEGEASKYIKPSENFKLSSVALADMYSGVTEQDVEWRKLGFGKTGMLDKNGIHPDSVADLFGFTSGDAMVRAIINAPALKAEIAQKTDAAMLDKYGDLKDQDRIQQAADAALHNTMRGRAVATELAALDTRLGNRNAILKAAKAYVEELIDRRTPKTLRPDIFAGAEARFSREALARLKKGDNRGAADAKRAELVNHLANTASHEAKAAMQSMVRKWQRIASYGDKSSAVKDRDYGTVSAVRAILASKGINPGRAKSVEEYLRSVRETDQAEADRIQALIDSVDSSKSWRDTTYANLKMLDEEITAMWRQASNERDMEVGGRKVLLDTVVEELLANLAGKPTASNTPSSAHATTEKDKRYMWFREWLAKLRRMEFFTGDLDGGNFGPWTQYLFTPIKDAEIAYMAERTQVMAKYRDLLETERERVKKKELIEAPEIGYTFGKGEGGNGLAELLHAMLHTGNESNKRKLLLGYNWAPPATPKEPVDTTRWDAFMGRMEREGRVTKQDWDFAQAVWDLMETLKPGAQAAHREAFGKSFNTVTANSFSNSTGAYRGGYVPAITDPTKVLDAALRKLAEEEAETLQNAFPATGKGFTMSRVAGYNQPLRLDLRTLGNHIDKVLRFTHLTNPISNANRIVARVGKELDRVRPQSVEFLVTPWLNRVATQATEEKTDTMGQVTKFWTYIRNNTGMGFMMGNVSNTLQQITGFSTALTLVGPKHMWNAFGPALAHPFEHAEFVRSKSAYMSVRADSEASAITGAVQDILLNPGIYKSAKAWTQRHAYVLQTAVDNMMSPVIWTAAYNQAMQERAKMPDQTQAESESVRVADGVVRMTQGALGASDVALFESSGPFMKVFTQFAGYFNSQAQMMVRAWRKDVQGATGVTAKTAAALFIVTVGFMVPAIVSEIIAQAFRGGPKDDDDDGVLDDWLSALFITGPLKYAVAAVPVGGQAIMLGINSLNTKPYDDRLNTAPAISLFEKGVTGGFGETWNALTGKDVDTRKLITGWASLIQLGTGLPAYPAARPLGYLADVGQGKVSPTGPIDALRGTITGTASPDSKK